MSVTHSAEGSGGTAVVGGQLGVVAVVVVHASRGVFRVSEKLIRNLGFFEIFEIFARPFHGLKPLAMGII